VLPPVVGAEVPEPLEQPANVTKAIKDVAISFDFTHSLFQELSSFGALAPAFG
jgi:hypothetical protein